MMTTPTTSDEIRRAFLDFFNEVGHEIVDSSPLVPAGDSTLLFTNAGMNQFTEALLGLEQRPYQRATTSQKCMRVSGKHNDLENVGPSPRHHTFFEMLGNFSFGDYFKKEAIAFAWTFLTGELGLPKERLFATVHISDDDAAKLWEAHVEPERILRFDKENFWEMGDTGPCGPCSEIFYYGGPLEEMDASGVNVLDEYLEVWNLVFMQYDRAADGTLTPLPAQSIDTGMGLERIAQAVQGVESNYDTDLFMPILDRIQQLAGHSAEERAAAWVGYRVIADHARAATFLIGDGVVPGNEGRAYVLRLILRRALRFGKKIGFTTPFIAEVGDAVIEKMGNHYSGLRERRDFILEALRREEESFRRTLERGEALLADEIAALRAAGKGQLAGDAAFRLYDTYGFPFDLTKDIVEEAGLIVDRDGFDRAMAEQRARARAAGTFNVDEWAQNYRRLAESLPQTSFVGYDPAHLCGEPVQIVTLVSSEGGEPLDEAPEGSEVEILLNRTPFYAESGGQIADTGLIETEYGRARVLDVRRPVPAVVVHRAAVVSGTLRRGESATATIDEARRWDIMRNHTATHLLHQALRDVLGKHAEQRGSLVAPDYLRFDFSHLSGMSEGEIETVERAVNEAIRRDEPVLTREMALDEARQQGAMMLFGEKYGERVRVVAIGEERDGTRPYSVELCGGTHLSRTGQIGSFVITGEGSVSQGVRRLTAITGRAAEEQAREQRRLLRELAARADVAQPEQLASRLDQLKSELRERERQLAALQRAQSHGQLDALLARAEPAGEFRLLAAEVEADSVARLREMSDWLRDKLGSAVVVIGAVIDGKPMFIAAATDDAVAKGAHAGNLVRDLAKLVGGGGGGRPTLAQAGGRDAVALPAALTAAPALMRAQLGA